MAKKGGYPGFGGGGMNMQNVMAQAQRMQQQMQQAQAEAELIEVTASAGGGAVTATATGKRVIKSIEIKPEVVDPDDIEMLQDIILAAVNEALSQVEEQTSQKLSAVTGGMNMNGLF